MRQLSGLEDVEVPEPDAVERRLRGHFGLATTLLREALVRGQHAAAFTTASHARTHAGTVTWHETNAGVREGTAALGWTLDDTDGISRAISPDATTSIVVVSGNSSTGRKNKHPQAKRARGEAGIRLIKTMIQYEMIAVLPVSSIKAIPKDVNRVPTWFLLYYRDDNVVRSELSLARGVSASGALLQWKERLILPEIDMHDFGPSTGQGIRDDIGPDVVVPLERRAS